MGKIVMGISAGHNRGAAIVINGKLEVAIANERITRIKTDRSDNIPEEAMLYCLDALELTWDQIDEYVYNITEDINKVPEQFTELTGQSLDKLKFIPHHQAHAYSTFVASGFKEGVVVVADAMGSVYNDTTPIKDWYDLDESELKEGEEWAEGFSIYEFKEGQTKPEALYKKWIRFPYMPEYEGSIGYFYGMGAKQLVYNEKTNSWPAGKLMGLASYANKDFVNEIEDLSIRTDYDLQVPAAPFLSNIVDYRSDFQSKADIAGVYQKEQELNSIHLVEMASRMSDSKNVCVSGGSFLNCNTNELIIKSKLFDGMYFLPPADDSGIAIGCAYAGGIEDHIPSGEFMSAYTGKTYSDEEIISAILAFDERVAFTKLPDDELIQAAVGALYENQVIGWMQGGSETGPRALGNRSILANPSKKWMVEYINSEIKKREWYRPFAPSVLFEDQADIFELDTYSPYMLVTTEVKQEWRDKIPAVTHFDGTSRYQSVTESNNPRYHALITEFKKATSIPVVLNTSFNGPEEPIVETPENAINTMLNHDLKVLFINNYMIYRK